MSQTSPTNANTTTAPSSSGLPQAFIIGKSFIKAYYEVLSTNPENIGRFYKPESSTISHSFQASVPAEPKTLRAESIRDFFLWTKSTSSDDDDESPSGLSVDFGTGSIDAQETIGGNILLVVTGQMTLPTNTEPRSFVHTFVLSNSAPAGKKKNFYVHNDILRFIATPGDKADQVQEVQHVSSVKEEAVPQDKPADTETEGESKSPEATEGDKVDTAKDDKKDETKASIDKSKQQKDSKGKKKEKEATAAGTSTSDSKAGKSDKKKSGDGQSAEQAGKDEKKSKKGKTRSRSSKKGRGGSRSASPSDGKDNEDDSSSKAPGSWASLVAGSGGNTKLSPAAIAAATAASKLTESKKNEVKEAEKEKSTTGESREVNTTSKDSKTTSNGSSAAQRTPEATLLLKNISDRTKEAEVRTMFEPYASKLNQKILGITLKATSGFCFVDFDSKIVVDSILKEVEELKSNGKQQEGNKKFILHGKLLGVGRKVPVDKGSSAPKSRHNRRSGRQEKK